MKTKCRFLSENYCLKNLKACTLFKMLYFCLLKVRAQNADFICLI